MLPAVYATDETPAVTQEEQKFTGAYEKFYMTTLYDQGFLEIPEEMRAAVKISHSKYGDCLLLKGKVEDLNALRITIAEDFNFNKGSVGRLTFDGLKDKDVGMSAKAQVYLDNEAEPASEFELRKQMGKKEWANDGEKTVSLGSRKISGKHRISIGFNIEGKDAGDKTTVGLRALQFCKTTVPVMYFNIDESEGTVDAMNSSEDHSVECYGSVDLVVPDEFNADTTFRDEYGTQESQYGLNLEYIRGRGNSTWMDEKKPYKVKFDKAQDLFGFGKNKHWVLLANRFDNSLVRNRMTYWLGQQLGLEYTPQCVPVEVVMNGEFYGSYLLCEQIRVGKGRVTIDDLDDIKDVPAITDPMIKTGGYLLSMEYDDDPDKSFTTENGMNLYIESPDENASYFNDYIKAYTQKVENAIFGPNFKDAEGHPYTDYLDLNSAVDYWWVQEFSQNGDAYGSGSTYLYKKRDSENDPGKLYWGPLWDFDYVAWGDLEYDAEPSEDLYYTSTPWFEALKADPTFVKAVKTRWSEKGGLKDLMNEITRKGGRLDKYLAQMKTSYQYDHDKWGAYESSIDEYSGEIDQLRTWIMKRSKNVDKAVSGMKAEDHTVKFKINGKIVKKQVIHGFLRESDFPKVPKKKGYVFSEWINKETGESYVPGDIVVKNMTLTAKYVKRSKVVKPTAIFFKSYDAYTSIIEQSGSLYEEGSWYYPDYRVVPDEAIDYTIKWTSSDKSIATVNEDGGVQLLRKGTVTIKAKLNNGVSRSYKLHIVDDSEMLFSEELKVNKKSVHLYKGQCKQIVATPKEQPSYETERLWISDNEKVVSVDDIGVVRGEGRGTTTVMLVDSTNRKVHKVKVTVDNRGRKVVRKGSTYKITSDKKGKRRAMLVKANKAKTVIIPSYIKVDGYKYRITSVKAKAFAGSKARKVIVKTKRLSKKTIKNALKDSKVKKIKINVGKKNVNKQYVKKYKQIFTKKIVGRSVVVQ